MERAFHSTDVLVHPSCSLLIEISREQKAGAKILSVITVLCQIGLVKLLFFIGLLMWFVMITV